jgi:peptidoglycan/LPS O-acetylase OafA/YrhL
MSEVGQAVATAPLPLAGAAVPRVRRRGLDGVRGVAAAMVVVHHLALSGGWMSDPFAAQPNLSSGFERVMTYTPLHLLWAGGEAVFVFFVLSGYVLAGTDISTPRRTAGFVGKRFVRLYVPAAAAIALATAQHALIRRTAGEEDGWLRWHGTAVAWSDPLRLGTLMTDAGLQIDSVLWSLRWEVLFSAIVPIVLAVMALMIGRKAPFVGTALCACIALSIYQSSGVLFYLPMFLLGTLAALNESAIAARVERLRARLPDVVLGGAALAVGVLMLTVRWWANPVKLVQVHAVQQALAGLEQLVVVLGACLVVLAAVHIGSARRLFETGVLQRLGGRSFSLYLVHEPIIVSVAQRFDPQHRPFEFLAVSLVLVAAATEAFYRLVERPSIALARRVHARIVDAGAARAPGAPVATRP